MGISIFGRVAFWSIACVGVLASVARAHDMNLAPPSFTVDTKKIVPVDFVNQKLKIDFDVENERAKAVAIVDFVTGETGRPMFDLRSTPTKVILDNLHLKADQVKTVKTPDNITEVLMVDREVSPHVRHRMEIHYEILQDHLTWSEDGVSVGFFMSDVGADRDFLEQYAPANLEFDPFPLQATLKVEGTGSHKLFTNGKVTATGTNQWEVRFPDYYTSSSFYLHLTQKSLTVKQEDYHGLRATIPITVYSESETSATSAMKKAKEVVQELEADYGPFAHEKVVIYVTSAGGGMEYCGATMTSLSALGHELTHSYFARGVMPANGNAGWIDEAIASWRDNEYPMATGAPSRPPVNLGGFSPYRRTTPYEAYDEGATLMSEFDYMFQQNGREGLKPVLNQLFSAQQRRVITTPFFGKFLESAMNVDLKTIFQKYVYGKSGETENHLSFAPAIPRTAPLSHHPRKFTRQELAEAR